MEIQIDEALSMMEVIKCENIKVKVEKKLPCISVECCMGVQIFTT